MVAAWPHAIDSLALCNTLAGVSLEGFRSCRPDSQLVGCAPAFTRT